MRPFSFLERPTRGAGSRLTDAFVNFRHRDVKPFARRSESLGPSRGRACDASDGLPRYLTKPDCEKIDSACRLASSICSDCAIATCVAHTEILFECRFVDVGRARTRRLLYSDNSVSTGRHPAL